MTTEQIKQIMKSVKENHAKMEACLCHDFSIDVTPERRLGKKWQCTKCSGIIDIHAKIWYERGRKDAKHEIKLK